MKRGVEQDQGGSKASLFTLWSQHSPIMVVSTGFVCGLTEQVGLGLYH